CTNSPLLVIRMAYLEYSEKCFFAPIASLVQCLWVTRSCITSVPSRVSHPALPVEASKVCTVRPSCSTLSWWAWVSTWITWLRPTVNGEVRLGPPIAPLPALIPDRFASSRTCVPVGQKFCGRKWTWESSIQYHAPSTCGLVVTCRAAWTFLRLET